MSRLDITPIARVHFRTVTSSPDWKIRCTLLLITAATIAAGLANFRFEAASSVLAAVSLLAGALISAFTHLSTLRLRVNDLDEQASQRVRDQLDESAAHILTAALLCMLDALTLVVIQNFPIPKNESRLGAIPSALAVFLTLYIFMLFVITAHRMYAAYVDLNDVSDRYNGYRST